MSNENDESIVLDRDTSKPEPRLKRKVKKVRDLFGGFG